MSKKPGWQIAHEKNQKQKDRERAKEIKSGTREAWKTIFHRNKQPYDGVMGNPPEPMPGDLPEKFVKARERLLAEYSHEEILQFIDGALYCSPEYHDDVRTLNYIKQLSELENSERLKAHQGPDGYQATYNIAQSEMKSKFAVSRRGKLNSLNECIILLKPNNLDDLLKKFENEDLIENLYCSTRKKTKINVHDFKVDRENKIVRYTPRDKDQKDIKFSSLRETISRKKSPIKKK